MRGVWFGLMALGTVALACDGNTGTKSPADASAPIDVGLNWIPVPAGTFQMGCRQQDPYCDLDESPLHQVSLRAFDLTATLTTQAQYLAATASNPSMFVSCGDTCPVEDVSWTDARAFCTAVGGRLPTEAEFEYAARAGGTTPFICGTDASCLDDAAWYQANAGGTTHPVGKKVPNAFGLFDMTGNVWEWTEDCYHVTYDGAPTDGRAWTSGDCPGRVLHGSAYDIWLDGNLRLWARVPNDPSGTAPYIGFRCARTN